MAVVVVDQAGSEATAAERVYDKQLDGPARNAKQNGAWAEGLGSGLLPIPSPRCSYSRSGLDPHPLARRAATFATQNKSYSAAIRLNAIKVTRKGVKSEAANDAQHAN
jgi:hypothetical protein